MDQVLFWLFMPYDALIFPPHFWLKAIFGIATGLLIPRKMVGLLICALGNAALYIYLSWKHGPNLPADLIALAVWSIFAFVGSCVVGCRPDLALGYSEDCAGSWRTSASRCRRVDRRRSVAAGRGASHRACVVHRAHCGGWACGGGCGLRDRRLSPFVGRRSRAGAGRLAFPAQSPLVTIRIRYVCRVWPC